MAQNLNVVESRLFILHSQSFSSDNFQDNPTEIKRKGELSRLYRDTVDEKEKRKKLYRDW